MNCEIVNSFPLIRDRVPHLSISDQRAFKSQVVRLVIHLLKWKYQPAKQCHSWENSISDARDEIEEASPSIRARIGDVVLDSYPKARRDALIEMKMSLEEGNEIPEDCPFTVDGLCDDGFFPDGEHDGD